MSSGPLPIWIDDYTRYLYVEALPDQTCVTTAAFLERALAHFAALGIRVERILANSRMNYRSRPFLGAAAAHDIVLKRTRPYRPQANGKAERVIQTLLRELGLSALRDQSRSSIHSLCSSTRTITPGRTPPSRTVRPSLVSVNNLCEYNT